jgi:hypothetical protein
MVASWTTPNRHKGGYMTKLVGYRIDRGVKQDRISLDRDLFNQLVGMLEGLAEIRYRTEDNERHIKVLNDEIEALRYKIGTP